jgi:hypothetical protein
MSSVRGKSTQEMHAEGAVFVLNRPRNQVNSVQSTLFYQINRAADIRCLAKIEKSNVMVTETLNSTNLGTGTKSADRAAAHSTKL